MEGDARSYVAAQLGNLQGDKRLAKAKAEAVRCLAVKTGVVGEKKIPAFIAAQYFVREYNAGVSPENYTPSAGLDDQFNKVKIDFPEHYGKRSYARARFLMSSELVDTRVVGERLVKALPEDIPVKMYLAYQLCIFDGSLAARQRARKMVQGLGASKSLSFIQRHQAILVEVRSIFNQDADMKTERARVAKLIRAYLADYPKGWLSDLLRNTESSWRKRGDIT